MTEADKKRYEPGVWYEADDPDWMHVPGTVWGLVQGWQEHSGATWGRRKTGLVSHAGNDGWLDEDIRRIATRDAMDGWRLTHFRLVDWPDVPDGILE